MNIHNYTLEAFQINDEDFYDVDYWNGVAYESRKISGLTLKTLLGQNATTAKREIVQFINKTGSALSEGTIVYLKNSSSSSEYPEVELADASTEITSSKTIGAVYATVANDDIGIIVTSGEVDNLNTSMYNIGDRLWLSTTAGEVTTVMPTAPDHAVFIGTVTRSQNGNGRILYHIQNGFEVEELHNMSNTSVTTAVDTDEFLLKEASSGLWKKLSWLNAKKIVTDANLTTSDITTNNVSTTKHGFVPKAPNDTTKFLRGDGTWSAALPVELVVAASDETTALTTGTAKVTFRMPHAMTLTGVRASLSTAQASGSIFTVDINEGGNSILSTKLTIDNTEKTSTTATTPAVISDSALADDAEITIDIDQIGDGTAKGLKVVLIGTRA